MSNIPAGWISTTVGQSVDILTGFPFASARFSDTGVRLIRGSNVKRGKLDWSPGLTKYWQTHEAALRHLLLNEGDVVIAMDGALVGRSFARISRSDLPAYLVQRVARLRSTSMDQSLLYQWIRSGYFAQHVDSVKTHTAIPHISPRNIKDFQIAIPVSTQEQQRISDALSAADDLIITLERLITKKQAIKLGVMQQLLTGRSRLPGFTKPWEEHLIGRFLEFKNGLNKGSEFFGSGTPIVNFMDVMNGPVITAANLSGRVTLSRDEIRRFSAKKGDIFFTRTSETVEEVGTAAVLVDDVQDAVFSGFILRGRPRTTDCDSQFLAYLFQTDRVRRQVTSAATYTTRALTNGKSLSRIVVQVPSLDEQNAISSVLEDNESEISALERRLKKAADTKQGMMQQLLTGRTRLPVEEGSA
ncbi:restriction endonuclease subunit S [Streptomyces sp. B27]|uniref:restriction endonuclease subunit S n=1 Tax=Streptomyces sp. B27 TaxID=2485015 RepID=UPI000FD9EF28|nr:restriction endonuclease subunit S [Streptomyces sp. B27]